MRYPEIFPAFVRERAVGVIKVERGARRKPLAAARAATSTSVDEFLNLCSPLLVLGTPASEGRSPRRWPTRCHPLPRSPHHSVGAVSGAPNAWPVMCCSATGASGHWLGRGSNWVGASVLKPGTLGRVIAIEMVPSLDALCNALHNGGPRSARSGF